MPRPAGKRPPESLSTRRTTRRTRPISARRAPASNVKVHHVEKAPTEAVAPGSSAAQPTTPQLAAWGTRATASLIDWGASFGILIVGVIISTIVGAVVGALGFLVGLVLYLGAAASGFYFAYMTGACGQSPGKRVVGIKVISEETGDVIGGGAGVLRQFAHLIDSLIFYVGWLLPLWDPKRQTLADKVMKTIVISNVPKQPFSLQVFRLS